MRLLGRTYLAAGDRCAVDLGELDLSVSNETALAALERAGFSVIDVDVVETARELIGSSRFKRFVHPDEAPDQVDCSSFVMWAYAQRGVLLPRRPIQQIVMADAVPVENIRAGDLVFLEGARPLYFNDPGAGVGHVGIATGDGGIIQASNGRQGVIESSLESFTESERFRGAGRIVHSESTLTLQAPPDRFIQTSDDIRWIVLSFLPW